MDERKVYYSGKYHLYGYKTKLSVLFNGIAIGMFPCYPGSMSGIDIFQKNKNCHEKYSKKASEEIDYLEEGELSQNHPSFLGNSL